MIADKLTYKELEEGDLIIRKGDDGDCMYLLFSGEVNVIANDEGVITTVLSEN